MDPAVLAGARHPPCRRLDCSAGAGPDPRTASASSLPSSAPR